MKYYKHNWSFLPVHCFLLFTYCIHTAYYSEGQSSTNNRLHNATTYQQHLLSIHIQHYFFFFFLTCFHLDILGLSATPATWTKSEEPMQKPIVTFLTKSHLACFLQVGCPISSNLHCHPMSVISLVQSTLIVLRPIVT